MTNAVVETRRPDAVTTDEDKAKTKAIVILSSSKALQSNDAFLNPNKTVVEMPMPTSAHVIGTGPGLRSTP